MNTQDVSDRLYYAIRLYWENSNPGPGVCLAVESAMADYELIRLEKEISANDVRKWLIDNNERMQERYGREYHYSVLDVEEAIIAIKQGRVKL